MSLLRNVAATVATQGLTAPLGLLTQILLARLLPVAERGHVAIANEVVFLTVSVIQLGWPQATVFRVRNVGTPISVAAAGAVYAGLALAAIAVAAGLSAPSAWTEQLLAGAPRIVLLIALATVPFELLGQLATGVARAADRFDLHNGYPLLSTSLVLGCVSFGLIGLGASAAHAISAQLVGTALAAATILALVLRASGFSPRVPAAELRASLGYGVTGHLQSVLANAHLRIDVLMLAALLQDPSAVAVYTIAATIVNRVRVIPAAIAIAVFPSFAEADASEAARLTARVLRHSTLVVTLSVLALVPAMIWLVPLLFGTAYEASVPLALVTLPGATLLSVQAIVGRYFAARNLQRVNVFCSGLGLALNVIANSLLIPSLG
ncbi:MAG TPA: oligosaccharide flippase family protein, partial [Myxococcota bacterium]|nr:oligosaccharide flippase family protein [Myxococcota bacterium]